MANKILCPINGTPENEPVLDAAYSVAKELNSHLEVLHVRTEAKESIPLLGEGMSVAMVEDMIAIAEKESGERLQRAKAAFDASVIRHGIKVANEPEGAERSASVAWKVEVGREDEVVARVGRLSDLIVVGRPGDSDDVLTPMTLNAAIFESGRPVLVVPQQGSKPPRRVAISWNGSAQSARAVQSAVRLLEQAEAVLVMTADSYRTSGVRGHELASYLQWHGIKPDTHVFEAPAAGVGPRLLEECKEFGADLLVCGAYTHSRMRQLILGGVTRHLLGHAEIPMLMAH